MNNDYIILQKRIEEIILSIENIINYSQDILENPDKPFIDRNYFSHIFNIFHFQWNMLFDTIETIESLKDRNELERIKYLLTNLPGEATNDHT